MKIYGDTKSGNCLKVKWVCDLLALPVGSAPAVPLPCIAVPPALAAYAVESARAADYDWLLGQGGRP